MHPLSLAPKVCRRFSVITAPSGYEVGHPAIDHNFQGLFAAELPCYSGASVVSDLKSNGEAHWPWETGLENQCSLTTLARTALHQEFHLCAEEVKDYPRKASHTQYPSPDQSSPSPREIAERSRPSDQKTEEKPGVLVSMAETMPSRDAPRRSSLLSLSEADFLNSEHDRSSVESRPGVVSLSYMMSVWDRDSNENVSSVLPSFISPEFNYVNTLHHT